MIFCLLKSEKCTTIGNCKISCLLFADDLVLLSSTELGLQRALNSFVDTCDTAGMKISTAKPEVLHLSRNLDQCELQVSGATLKNTKPDVLVNDLLKFKTAFMIKVGNYLLAGEFQ